MNSSQWIHKIAPVHWSAFVKKRRAHVVFIPWLAKPAPSFAMMHVPATFDKLRCLTNELTH